MANFIGVLAARRAKAPWDVRAEGMGDGRLRMYCSAETHTWVQKAADMFGLGTDALRWIPTDATLRMDVAALRNAVAADRAEGLAPVPRDRHRRLGVDRRSRSAARAGRLLPRGRPVAARGRRLRRVRGGSARAPGRPARARRGGLDRARPAQMALHAGRGRLRARRSDADLLAAFDYTPPYYSLDEEELHYYKRGPQNSRGFRALKVWLSLRHLGREGYADLIEDDIRLARELDELVDASPCSSAARAAQHLHVPVRRATARPTTSSTS